MSCLCLCRLLSRKEAFLAESLVRDASGGDVSERLKDDVVSTDGDGMMGVRGRRLLNQLLLVSIVNR